MRQNKASKAQDAEGISFGIYPLLDVVSIYVPKRLGKT
jgi:hypothetical protein